MSRPLRVLLIEDSDDDAELLVREVRRAGYDAFSERVDTVAGLESALDAPWDIILCDYQMPGLDAPRALSVVRARSVETPCIIVSGTIGEEHAVAALRSGAHDFVLKSNLTRLVPAIERELRDSEVRIKHARAEMALRETEASFRAAFELIPDGVLVWKDDIVVHANSSAVAMLGAGNLDDLIPLALPDLFDEPDREPVRRRLEEMQGSNAPVSLGERAMMRLDSRVVHVDATIMSVLFDGEPGLLAVIRDVSARRELVARAMQVDRMLAVGTLAAGVGHEINNPLAYIMANLSYASDQVAASHRELASLADGPPAVGAVADRLTEVVSILKEVDDGTRRIRDIARDLNTLARNDEELQLVDVRAVTDSALRMASLETRQRAPVVRRYEEVPPVRASASRLSQVLLNLVLNAAHAIEKGAYDANEIAVHIRAEAARVVVEVRDTGCGISPSSRERLFTPFFTTKPIGQGTGLGLSISKRIVESLGGDIEVDSTPGSGTTMRVLLPAAQQAARHPVVAPGAFTARARVLFVDDERLVGTAFQRALSHEHDVIVVESAAAALARLSAGESYDLIFCDFNMPEMTGGDLFEALSRAWPRMAERFVLITGARPVAKLAALGKVPVLEKPLDMDQVRALLGRALLRTAPRTVVA